jgi:hypothetical protein
LRSQLNSAAVQAFEDKIDGVEILGWLLLADDSCVDDRVI